jgi:hypothetical protein
MDVGDAQQFIIYALRSARADQLRQYGYELYVPSTVYEYYLANGEPVQWDDQRFREATPAFMDAAWALCTAGILRPGVAQWRAQSTTDGSAGCGFSLTPSGREWLKDKAYDEFIPTEPERLARMLEPFRRRFGDVFHDRAQESVRCYRARAYLACCAMCGAAAESILLSVAIAKSGNEKQTLATYRTAQGRTRIESSIVGQADERLKNGIHGVTGLLKYWRDAAAHGARAAVSDHEAHVALLLLLRHAAFVEDNWSDLVHRAS